ncbi:glycine cleavage system protein GcvH [bacterium]|nr:glycine cleavage system protein GcvH [bacterium]
MEVRSDLKYSEDHEWIRIEGNTVVLGITDYAQNSLSDIVYVEVPEVGTIVDAGEEVGNIESVKAVAALYSPLAGEVVKVNKSLEDEPELVNTDPYDNGWIMEIEILTGELERADLMNDDEYEEYIAKLK